MSRRLFFAASCLALAAETAAATPTCTPLGGAVIANGVSAFLDVPLPASAKLAAGDKLVVITGGNSTNPPNTDVITGCKPISAGSSTDKCAVALVNSGVSTIRAVIAPTSVFASVYSYKNPDWVVGWTHQLTSSEASAVVAGSDKIRARWESSSGYKFVVVLKLTEVSPTPEASCVDQAAGEACSRPSGTSPSITVSGGSANRVMVAASILQATDPVYTEDPAWTTATTLEGDQLIAGNRDADVACKVVSSPDPQPYRPTVGGTGPATIMTWSSYAGVSAPVVAQPPPSAAASGAGP